jgi:hypothetical protein
MKVVYNIVLISNTSFQANMDGKNGRTKIGAVVSLWETHTDGTLDARLTDLAKEHKIRIDEIEVSRQ